MSWTKRKLVEEAFAELALAGYDFDLSPDELDTGLRRLDSMMATWSGIGIQLGYSMATSQDDSDLDQDSGVPMFANEAVFMSLAIKLAAGKGKALPSSTRTNAKQAYDAMLVPLTKAQVQEQQLAAGTPRGQGRKPWRTINPYVTSPNTSPLQVDESGGLDFNGLGN
ncbi:MAG: hypothetical protein HXX19_13050 [Rhodoferax sp.]|nr:hypothetical protein [Rhodoferax sp.]